MEKTVSKIENLNHEVKVLKKENRELRAKLNDTDNVDGHFGLLPISAEISE
jgi:small nuclear ribonucleoprotein (snRNP)-like protein